MLAQQKSLVRYAMVQHLYSRIQTTRSPICIARMQRWQLRLSWLPAAWKISRIWTLLSLAGKQYLKLSQTNGLKEDDFITDMGLVSAPLVPYSNDYCPEKGSRWESPFQE